MNKLCKQYVSKVKYLFPIIRKEEVKYLKKLEQNLEDCCANDEPESIEALYQEFGAPEDVIYSYFTNINVDYVIRCIRRTKLIRNILITLVTISLIASILYSANLYYTYKSFEAAKPCVEETFIE